MYIETVPNRNSPPAILLREGWRENGKVRKRTLANLSKWPKGKIDTLCGFRSNPITESGASRSLIPIQPDH